MPVKYMPLSQNDEAVVDFTSIFSYSALSDHKKSYFTYTNISKQFEGVTIAKTSAGSVGSKILETLFILTCYLVLAICFPLSLMFCLKFVKEKEKCVIFRLGRLQNPKGPGAILILPCIDRWQTVDMSTKAFNIPPIQAITGDGGIAELGATVYYSVKDPVQSVLGVQDLGPSLRTLAHTIVHREINKRNLRELTNEKRTCTEDLKVEINQAVFAWGVEIKEIELCGIKVIKEPNLPLAGILGSLFGGGGSTDASSSSYKLMPPNMSTVSKNSENNNRRIPEEKLDLNMQTLIALVQPILGSVELVQAVDAIYQFDIEELGSIILDLKNGSGSVAIGSSENCDVVVELSKSNCLDIFFGRLKPFEAYMHGDIQIRGNLKTAMKLQILQQALINYYKNFPSCC